MTSTFDNLETIFILLERGEKPEFKEDAEKLADKVKIEIEKKIGVVKLPEWAKTSWGRYFSMIHSNYDHTDKWHLKLVSIKTDSEIDKFYRKFMNYDEEMKS